MISSYKVSNGKIYINTPYCDDIVTICRKWAGKFQDGNWVVPVTRLPDVQLALGTELEDQVEVEVGQQEIKSYGGAGQQYRVGWYVLCGRRGRDSQADVYADLVAGEIPAYGGSMKHPLVQASEDARFRFWCARDFAVGLGLQIVTDPKAEEPVKQAPAVNLHDVSTDMLLAELARRGVTA
jgi:hypothetical protein